jgi:molecular chaperone HtpG
MTSNTYKFEAETEKIFQLMVHSLYENKEIFIRELISNASDALDKVRYLASTDDKIQKLQADDGDLSITLELDKEKRLFVISDNGIGMSEEELKENLGTIAKSGTQSFLTQLTGDKKKDSQLIGQFGVGFYSSFMVADHITVISKSAKSDQAYMWSSEGKGEFQIEKVDSDLKKGTIITLHIKEDEDEFLDRFRVKSIIQAYSSHVPFKINYREDNGELTEINDGNAIWKKNKSEISEEEYNEFYKSVSNLGEDQPWMTLHNKAEGLVEYTNLLYIPNKKPFDLYHPDRLTRIKLYIKRVLISEKLEIIPQYLRFLKGVVDSDDLPLNISRETVQNDVKLQKIKSSITKKVLKELSKKLVKDRKSYLEFWNNFGAVLKEGLCDGMEPRDEILESCLFQTDKSEDFISLKEYKERMQEGQKSIYFINAADRKSALASPQIEGFQAKGYEVIILIDSVDDFWVNVIHEYDSIPFKSVTKAGSDLEENSEKPEDEKSESKDEKEQEKDNKTGDEALDNLVAEIKNILGDKISQVRQTARLKDSPVCITVPEGAMDIRLERFMIENKQLAAPTAKIFEINPEHSIIKRLKDKLAKSQSDESLKSQVADTIEILYAQASITEGEPVPDIKKYNNYINKLIEKDMAA